MTRWLGASTMCLRWFSVPRARSHRAKHRSEAWPAAGTRNADSPSGQPAAASTANNVSFLATTAGIVRDCGIGVAEWSTWDPVSVRWRRPNDQAEAHAAKPAAPPHERSEGAYQAAAHCHHCGAQARAVAPRELEVARADPACLSCFPQLRIDWPGRQRFAASDHFVCGPPMRALGRSRPLRWADRELRNAKRRPGSEPGRHVGREGIGRG